MNEQDEHRGLFGEPNVENALLLRAARSFVPLVQAADPRLRQLLMWNARTLLVGVLVSPVGWVLRRLLVPQAVYVSRGVVPFWSGVSELLVHGAEVGLVLTVLAFLLWPIFRRSLELDDLDGLKVGFLHDARWQGMGVYFYLAAATVCVTIGAMFSLSADASGPRAAFFLSSLTTEWMFPLALLLGATFRALLLELGRVVPEAASGRPLEASGEAP